MDEVEDEEKCPLLAHGGPLAQLTVRAVPEADLAYCRYQYLREADQPC